MPTASADALVLVDKPSGVTSFDVVRVVSRVLGTRKAGHTGTLDPFATGLLVVLTGKGTRLIRFVPGEPKVYRTTIRFGEERDTDDLTGAVTRHAPLPDLADLAAALQALTGDVLQVPPTYSAKKVDGQRAYAMARAGEPPELAPVRVRVHAWEVVESEPGRLDVRITCGGGTYVRALARDLGRALASAAYVSELRRERSGPFDVSMADPWDALRAGTVHAHTLHEALGDLARETLTPDEAGRVAHGMAVDARGDAGRAALLTDGGELLAVARREQGRWQPEVVLAHA